MSFPSRLKSTLGGKVKPDAARTLASATSIRLPDNDNFFYISGTTTVNTLNVPPHLRNRRVLFVGAASANFTVTNNNSPTTTANAGQIYLQGSNLQIQEDDAIELFCKADGTWILLNTTAA